MSNEEHKDCGCCCGGKENKFMKFVKNHKKLSWTVGIIVVLLIIFRISLGLIIQKGVATVAPMITGVPVSIGNVSVRILSGYVALSDVKVGNPRGYKAENMVTLEKAVFDIAPLSVFSDKIRIEEITVTGLNLYYEQKLRSNNISDLQANVEERLGVKKDPAAKKEKPVAKKEEKGSEPKKLQVDQIHLNDITAHVVVAGADVPVMMIPINMENLGTGPEGITAGGVFAAILDKLSLGAAGAVVEATKKAGAATGKALQDLGKQTGNALKDAGKGLEESSQKLKNLFSK